MLNNSVVKSVVNDEKVWVYNLADLRTCDTLSNKLCVNVLKGVKLSPVH